MRVESLEVPWSHLKQVLKLIGKQIETFFSYWSGDMLQLELRRQKRNIYEDCTSVDSRTKV